MYLTISWPDAVFDASGLLARRPVIIMRETERGAEVVKERAARPARWKRGRKDDVERGILTFV